MPIDTNPIDPAIRPVILAGPILRRLTRTQVSVWVAVSSGGELQFRVRRDGEPASEQVFAGTPIRVGRHLWLGVLTASGIDGGQFLAGQRYGYTIARAGGFAIGIPPDWTTFAVTGSTPTFLGLPGRVDELRVAQVSCRKPHGGARDGLALLADSMTGPDRPHLLMMTGDQIYADDVAGALMLEVLRVARDIVDDAGRGLGAADDDGQIFGPLPPLAAASLNARAAAAEGFGLTSGEATNHLFRFAEYLAMYLLAWSDTLWPAQLARWTDVAGQLGDAGGEHAQDESGWNAQLERLGLFRQSLASVRRLLANAPCLMIFDDHEVTDDWNLNHAWASSLYALDGGRRVITNGLAAYALCQHWGNAPEAFATAGSPAAGVLAATPWQAGVPRDYPTLDTVLGVPDLAGVDLPTSATAPWRPLAGTVPFHYRLQASDGWPLDLIVIDGRTARAFPTATGPASRLAPDALDAMLPPPPAGAALRPSIVVLPAPFLGTHLIEHMIQPAAALLPGGAEFADFESWSAFGPGFEIAVARLARYRLSALLSGDVHYGFTTTVLYQNAAGFGRAAQFTSSGAKNADPLTLTLHSFSDLLMKVGIVRARTRYGYAALSDAERARFLNPPSNAMLPYDDMVDVLLGRVFRDAQAQPAVFSREVALAYGLGEAPDFQYTTQPITDERLPAAGPLRDALDDAPAGSPPGWNPDNSVKLVRGLRAFDLIRIGRVFTGLPQMGRLGFAFDAAAETLTVQQVLESAIGDDPSDSERMTTTTSATLSAAAV